MTTLKNSKPVLAEVLVRQVFGEAENFERVCAQRGVSVEQAVSQALRGWIRQERPTGLGVAGASGSDLPVSSDSGSNPGPVALLLPDPAECPQGEERHWLEIIEHDLGALQQNQRLCFKSKDAEGLAQTNRSIETYLQARASLRDRVA